MHQVLTTSLIAVALFIALLILLEVGRRVGRMTTNTHSPNSMSVVTWVGPQ